MDTEAKLKQYIPPTVATLLLLATVPTLLAGCQNEGNNGEQQLPPGMSPGTVDYLHPPTPPVFPTEDLLPGILQVIKEGVKDNGVTLAVNGQSFHYAFNELEVLIPGGVINPYTLQKAEVYMSNGVGTYLYAEGPLGLSALSALSLEPVLAQMEARSNEQPKLEKLRKFLLSTSTAEIFSSQTLTPAMKQVLAGQGYHIKTDLSPILDEHGNAIDSTRKLVVTDSSGESIFYMEFKTTSQVNQFQILDIQVLSSQSRGATNKITTKPTVQHRIHGKRRRPATTTEEREVQWWFQEGYQSRTRVLGEPLIEAFSQYIEGDGITVAQAKGWKEEQKAQGPKTLHNYRRHSRTNSLPNNRQQRRRV